MSKQYDDEFEEADMTRVPEEDLDLDLDLDFDEEERMEVRRVERSQRTRRRKKKKKKSHLALWLILLMLLAVGGVVGGKYYAQKQGIDISDLMTKIPFLGDQAQPETEPETEPESTEAPTEPETEMILEKDSNMEVLDLVKSYFDARLAADTEALSKILAEGVVVNADQLNSEKEFVEAYQEVSTYLTDGMMPGEYAVFVSYSQKFKDIDTAVPGLFPAYVSKAADGSLRLSFFNDWTEDLKGYMNTVAAAPAVYQLSGEVGERFELAKESDEKLKNFLAVLTGETVEPETEAPAETTTAAETTKAAESGDITFTEVDDIQYAKANVKCRKKPSLEDTDQYIMLEEGTKVHVIATSEKWSKVVTFGAQPYTGYVYKEYLSVDPVPTKVANAG